MGKFENVSLEKSALGLKYQELDKLDAEDLLDLCRDIRISPYGKNKHQKMRYEYNALLQYFQKIMNNNDKRITLKNLAVLQYEAGYTAFLDGDYEDAIKLLDQSTVSAERCSDEIGVEIGRYMAAHFRFLSGKISLDEARIAALNALDRFSFIYKKN